MEPKTDEKTDRVAQKGEPLTPLQRAVARCRAVADTYDHDAYNHAASDLCTLLPNYKSHTVDSDASGYYINVRMYFPNKKHR